MGGSYLKHLVKAYGASYTYLYMLVKVNFGSVLQAGSYQLKTEKKKKNVTSSKPSREGVAILATNHLI